MDRTASTGDAEMIGLVDPDPLHQMAWRSWFAAHGFPLAWIASTAADARRALNGHPTAFLLIRFDLPDESGARLLHSIRPALPGLRALLLVHTAHPAVEALAYRAGALGCLGWESSCDQMLHALPHALKGRPLWTLETVYRVEDWWRTWGAPWAALSPRQRRIAWAAAHGLSDKEIARWLGCSKETVRTHLSRALERLGRADRVDLARWLFRGGLRDPRCAALLDLEPMPDERTLLEAIEPDWIESPPILSPTAG
jgi:DNA-binding NarL/FixJ family response regulator